MTEAVRQEGTASLWRGGLRELRLALFLGMELAWVTGLTLLIATRLPPPLAPEAQPSFVWVVALAVWGWAAARLLRPERWTIWVGVAAGGLVLGIGLAVAMFLLVSDPLAERERAITLAVVGGLAGLRGWLLAGRDPDREGFIIAFQVGCAVLLGVVALGSLFALPLTAATLAILGFLTCALFGLWLSGEGPGGAGRPHLTGAVAVVLVLALGGLAVALVDRTVVDLALALVVWVWEMIARLAAFLAALLPEPEPGEIPPMEAPAGGPPIPASEPRFALFDGLRPIAEFVFIAIWVGLIGAVLVRGILSLMRWLGRRRTPSAGLMVSDSGSSLWSDLRLLLNWALLKFRSLWRRLFGRATDSAATADPARRLYRRFLVWTALRGLPRSPAVTPDEHRDLVSRQLPSAAGVADAILAAYLPARYGPGGPDPALLAAAEGAIRRLGRRGVRAAGAASKLKE